MLPRDLKIELFAAYPPEARSLVSAHLAVIQRLPLSFLPSLLRQLIDYDFKFPAERASADRELQNLSSLTSTQINDWFQAFSQISLNEKLESFDWINLPAQFVEQQAAYLWSTHQLDAFRKAAMNYGDRLSTAAPPQALPVRRLGIAVIGQSVEKYDQPLFRYLRPHGTYFSKVKPENGLELLLAGAAARAQAHPSPYAHWYVDGGQPSDHSDSLTSVSYKALEPVRASILKYMTSEIQRPGMGPEELRTNLAKLSPAELGIEKSQDAVLSRFEVRLFTEGSGTQIFSTTFAQWTAREVLRRAQALTLLVRFAPRQRQRPMNEMLADAHPSAATDPVGSLVDGDMAAYYQWLNQQRLPGAEQSSFLVWFEGHNQALAIAPNMAKGAQSDADVNLADLVKLITA